MANNPAREQSWDVFVRQVDPDYDRALHRETEFEFSPNRDFVADRPHRFPYDVTSIRVTADSLDLTADSTVVTADCARAVIVLG